jgi:hypothetical protein
LARKRKPRLDPLRDFDVEAFMADVNAGDALQLVVRVHIYVQSALVALVEAKLPAPQAIDLTRLAFPSLVDLAIAHEVLFPSEKAAYLELNALRNSFAHNLRHSVTVGEVADLIASLDSVQLAIVSAQLGRQPLAGRDFAHVLMMLFAVLQSRLATIREVGTAESTGLARRYQEELLRVESGHLPTAGDAS